MNHYQFFQFAPNVLSTFVINEIQVENLIGVSNQIKTGILSTSQLTLLCTPGLPFSVGNF